MNYVKKGLMLISMVFLLTACGGSNRLPVSVPGEEDGYNQMLQSVVALVQKTEDGGVRGPTCTAFFISERDLITAGHCVLEVEHRLVFGPRGFAIESTFEDPEEAIGKEVHFVNRVQYDAWVGMPEDDRVDYPDYSSAKVMAVLGPEEEDVALLRLSKDVPSSQTWLDVRDWNEMVPRVGEEIYSLSMPVGRAWMLTRGIVSAIQFRLDGKIDVYHDAHIGPGSSGSPLVDANGNVVGVNVRRTPESVLFIASPSTNIQTLYNLLQTRLELEELDQ